MNGSRVLIVDDNEANIDLARFVLEDAGFVVEARTDAASLRKSIRGFRPALILMDIQLEGADGLELTRCIKADPEIRDTLVVAFTAYAMKGDEARMREAGCDGYIAKPIDVASFAQQVEAVLHMTSLLNVDSPPPEAG